MFLGSAADEWRDIVHAGPARIRGPSYRCWTQTTRIRLGEQAELFDRELRRGGSTDPDGAFARGPISSRIGAPGADDDVVDAVPVDVARRAHGAARAVTRVDAGEHEATAAIAPAGRVQGHERHDRREAVRRTK